MKLCRKSDEIRTQYTYSGLIQREEVGRTEEGGLYLVEFDCALDLDVSATTRFTLEYDAMIGSQTSSIYVGSVDARDGKPRIGWMALRDWG